MRRIAAVLLVLTFAGSPALAVVCGFVCEPEPAADAAAGTCHGEHADHQGTTSISARLGCDHDVAPALLMLQTAKLVPMPGNFVSTAITPVLVAPGRLAGAVFEYPPGGTPAALAARTTVLRL